MSVFCHFYRGLVCSTMKFSVFVLGCLLITVPVASVRGQPTGATGGEQLAPAVAPRIYKATAVKKDEQVIVSVSAREIRITKKDPDDKDAKDWISCWTEQDPLILGKQIRAYKPSGEAIDEAALLKALEKPVAVACFQRMHKDDPEKPDPFYTGIFREDAVILVFEAKYWLRE